ncbi:phosphoethanolamine transferase EptA [Buttiauxella warmboldiae]|uniref:Phosphoethanolamine transferase EptA n=1 Tax=Buttiauxella warmboldiae TaxID=82993 RepID=A0A3N5DS66_9ENTR|nr:phosphoethanolamine transferase EptA [Buttiauxella warmboldiae]RPH29981.1 phosphoethanolamine transferase EptA [Buttiauxella warmboldiae]
MITLKKLQCNDNKFNLCCACFFTLINFLFIQHAWKIITPDSFHSWIFALSIPLVLFSAWLTIFSLINLPWLRKPVLIILVMGCAASNYFMVTYGAVIDKEMMINVFETDAQEAVALMTPQLLAWLLFTGIVPAVILAAIKIKPSRWWHTLLARLVSVLTGLLIIILVASVFYKDYASLFRNNKNLTRMVTPANYISAISRYSQTRWFAGDQTLVKIGEDARKGPLILQQHKKTVVVFVVGEASRAENYSLNGYARETNPELKKQGVIYFPNASSCGTETAISVPCMFSSMARKNYDASLAHHQEGLMDVLAHAGVNLLWRDNDGGCKGACDRIPHTDMTQWNIDALCKDQSCWDDVLLHRFSNVLDGLQQDSVIVLHLMGSHGPAYYRRYPDKFRKFTPTCDSNQIQDCDRQSLINTYDNTILYTDDIVSRTIDALGAHGDKFNTALVYLSDHGESLGENGIYLHGTPYMLAPAQQTHIPFLFWLSQDYQQNFALNGHCVANKAASEPVSQDNIFSTLLGMMNIKTSVYQKDMDILAACRQA